MQVSTSRNYHNYKPGTGNRKHPIKSGGKKKMAQKKKPRVSKEDKCLKALGPEKGYVVGVIREGYRLADQGKFTEIIKILPRITPSTLNAKHLATFLQLKAIAEKKGDSAEIAKTLSATVKKENKDNPFLLCILGNEYLRIGKRAEARRCLRAAKKLQSDFTQAKNLERKIKNFTPGSIASRDKLAKFNALMEEGVSAKKRKERKSALLYFLKAGKVWINSLLAENIISLLPKLDVEPHDLESLKVKIAGFIEKLEHRDQLFLLKKFEKRGDKDIVKFLKKITAPQKAPVKKTRAKKK